MINHSKSNSAEVSYNQNKDIGKERSVILVCERLAKCESTNLCFIRFDVEPFLANNSYNSKKYLIKQL